MSAGDPNGQRIPLRVVLSALSDEMRSVGREFPETEHYTLETPVEGFVQDLSGVGDVSVRGVMVNGEVAEKVSWSTMESVKYGSE
jgi:hypothetical protein